MTISLSRLQKQNWWEWNTAGRTRWVLLTKRWAIKIPRFENWRTFLNGLLANMNERERWRRQFFPRLCPVVLSSRNGWLLIMARAEELTEPEAAQAFLESSKISELSNLSELDPTCFAELNGDWVIIDYGHGATARIWPIVSKVGD